MEHKLSMVLEKHPDCIRNRIMFVGVIRDYFPSERVLANIIINLYDLDILKGIDEADEVDDLFISRYVRMLANNYGIKESLGLNAVQEWCLAYGKKYEINIEKEEFLKAENASELIQLDDLTIEEHVSVVDEDACDVLQNAIDVVLSQMEDYSRQLNIDSIDDYLAVANPAQYKALFINGDIPNIDINKFLNVESLAFGSKFSLQIPDISGLKKLRRVSLHGDRTWQEVTSIDLSSIEELSCTVLCDEWRVGFIAPNLKSLTIFCTKEEGVGGNKGEIDFSFLPQLKKLHIRHAELTNYSSICKLHNLEELLIGDEEMTDVSFVSEMKQLNKLILWGKLIDICPIYRLYNLKYLDLSRNLISDCSGLANLDELNHLDLYGNPIAVDFDRSKIEWSCVTDEEKAIRRIESGIDDDIRQSVRFIKNCEKTNLQDVPEWRRRAEERNRKLPFIDRVKQLHQSRFESGFSGMNQLRSMGAAVLDETFAREHYIKYATAKYPYLTVTQEMKKMLALGKRKLIHEYSGKDCLACIIKGDLFIIRVSIGTGKGEINVQSDLYSYKTRKIIETIRDNWSTYISKRLDECMVNIAIKDIYGVHNDNIEDCLALFSLIPIKCVIDDIDLGTNKVLIGEVKKTGEFKRNKPTHRELEVAISKGTEKVICYGTKKTYSDYEYTKLDLSFVPIKFLTDLFEKKDSKGDIYQMSIFDY